MADDTMEISSEHGRNMGDEDIDIDIDFTTARVDEDYVLEDAISNAGFGDTFQPHPSAMGPDDLMTDEIDESYPMHMDGADLMRDDITQTMEDELLETPSALAGIPIALVEESYVENTSHLRDGSVNDEVFWEANDDPAPIDNKTSLDDLEARHEGHLESHVEGKDDGSLQDTTEGKEVEKPASGTPFEVSVPDTPLDRSKPFHAVADDPRNSPISISAPESESLDRGSTHTIGNSGSALNSQDNVSINTNVTTGETMSPSIPDVVVVYQGSEYSLFSKFDTDDIDSYFLSDITIVDKPLKQLFQAIRDIIHDDLSDEDELCMSAENLRLDFEEASCTHL